MNMDQNAVMRVADMAAAEHGHTLKHTDEIVGVMTSFARLMQEQAAATAAQPQEQGYVLHPVCVQALLEKARKYGQDRVTFGVMEPDAGPMGLPHYVGVVSESVEALEAALAGAKATGAQPPKPERAFPLLGYQLSIPWSALAPHEHVALKNHGQTLERLAERGGLSPLEAVCVIQGLHWSEARGASDEWALQALKKLTTVSARGQQSQALDNAPYPVAANPEGGA